MGTWAPPAAAGVATADIVVESSSLGVCHRRFEGGYALPEPPQRVGIRTGSLEALHAENAACRGCSSMLHSLQKLPRNRRSVPTRVPCARI